MLNDKHFLFWLSFVRRIMPHVDLLYYQFQSLNVNYDCHLALWNFYNAVSTIRNVTPLTSEISQEFKKRKRNEDLTIFAKEACDTIWFQAKERLKFTGHLSATKLLVSRQFPLYNRQFQSKNID
jgi:hypothetical protein